MPQFDFGHIDPLVKNGIELSDDLNRWRDAIHSCHWGAARPAYVATGMIWVSVAAYPVCHLNLFDGNSDVLLIAFDASTHAVVSSAVRADQVVVYPQGTLNSVNVQAALVELMNEKVALDGTGAGGTWPINVTGWSGTSGQATNATNVNGGRVAASSVSVTRASDPYLEVHKPGAAAWAWMLTSDNQFTATQTDGNGAYTGHLFTIMPAGHIRSAGNVIAFSDRRLKSDIEPITDALSKVIRLNGYTYMRHGGDGRETGVIAQEVQAVLPEAVSVSENDGMLGVAYGNMVGLLIEAIKELSAEVAVLRSKIQPS
jgi:hypothetical protein